MRITLPEVSAVVQESFIEVRSRFRDRLRTQAKSGVGAPSITFGDVNLVLWEFRALLLEKLNEAEIAARGWSLEETQ